jgi:hypothetical protein
MGKTNKKMKIIICEQTNKKRWKNEQNESQIKLSTWFSLSFFDQLVKDYLLILDIKFIKYFDLFK